MNNRNIYRYTDQEIQDIVAVMQFIHVNIDFFLIPYRKFLPSHNREQDDFKELEKEADETKLLEVITATLSSDSKFHYMPFITSIYLSIIKELNFFLSNKNFSRSLKEDLKFLSKNLKLVEVLKKSENQKIIDKWYETQATEKQTTNRSLIAKKYLEIDMEQYQEISKNVLGKKYAKQHQVEKYKSASSQYREYLISEIEKEVNELNNEDLTAGYLLNNYKYKGNNEEIEGQLADNPTLIDALKKYAVIIQGEKILDGSIPTTDKIGDYHKHLKKNKNKDILTKRRDTHFITFAKGLGVFACTILGVGVGGVIAYIYLFGSKATHGHQFINDVEEIHNSSNTKKIKIL